MGDMSIEIHLATVGHAPGIAALKRLAWPDETVDLTQVRTAIAAPGHAAWVALDAGLVLGFVDGFLTRSPAGIQRWEVDLLAVHPDYLRRGLGRRLVQVSTDAGRQRGASLARALIGVENVASQRTFARCAYQPEPGTCELYVSSKGRLPRGLHTLPVVTFNYTGFWAEGAWASLALDAAQMACLDGYGDLIGAVIPTEHVRGGQIERVWGAERVGRYRWWVLEGLAFRARVPRSAQNLRLCSAFMRIEE
jgi:GNAT superfamily N-acetyltransferase